MKINNDQICKNKILDEFYSIQEFTEFCPQCQSKLYFADDYTIECSKEISDDYTIHYLTCFNCDIIIPVRLVR